MKRKLVIFGGSGIGMIAASVAEATGEYDLLGFLNDLLPKGAEIGKFRKIKVLGNTNDVASFLSDENIDFFVGYVGMTREEEIFRKVESLEIPIHRYANLIHPTAIIPKGYCQIGRGVLFSPLSQLSPDVTISDNCILLPNSFVGHDSFLDRFAHVATNGVVGANVHVGKAVHIGSNATLREKIHVGDFSLIGAGAVVLNDVEPGSIVVGNPAKKIRGME